MINKFQSGILIKIRKRKNINGNVKNAKTKINGIKKKQHLHIVKHVNIKTKHYSK